MNKQNKIKKVAKEFEQGTLKTSFVKAKLISQINIDSLQEAEDILKAAGEEELFEKAKHQDGDMHPNGKWVWVSSANGGKGDWRTRGGRTHTKHSAGGNAGTGSTTTTQQKPTTQTTGTTSKRDEDFKKLMRNASDTVLSKIISGKIQASDRDKELAQEILNDRKKSKVGDVSKLTAQQKSMVDTVMDKGFLMTSSKYNDKSKVELKKTPIGNWRCYYDGRDIGATISGKLISDTAAKKIGWYKEETKSTATEPTDTTQTKPKKRPIGVGTNGPEKRTKLNFHVDNVSNVMKEIRASEDNIANYLGGDAEITNITYRQFITAKDEDGKTFNGIKITVNYKANSSYREGKEKKQPVDIIIDSNGFMRSYKTYYPSPHAALKRTYSKPNEYRHLVPSLKDKFEVK